MGSARFPTFATISFRDRTRKDGTYTIQRRTRRTSCVREYCESGKKSVGKEWEEWEGEFRDEEGRKDIIVELELLSFHSRLGVEIRCERAQSKSRSHSRVDQNGVDVALVGY